MKTAIVIPAYNEAATIAAVVRDVAGYGLPIVVDDQSTDETATLAEEAGATVVRRSANGGYDAALQSGFERADALGMDIVATFDADGQHVGEVLAKLLAPVRAGRVRLVLGTRPEAARMGEALFNYYTKWRYGVPDILCGMKGYAMTLYRQHGAFDTRASIGTELTLKALRTGEPFELLPVPIRPRQDTPRLGSVLRANKKILRALWLDLSGAHANKKGTTT